MSETPKFYKVHLQHPQYQCLVFPLVYEADGKMRSNDPTEHWDKGFVQLYWDADEEHVIPVHNIDWIEVITERVS